MISHSFHEADRQFDQLLTLLQARIAQRGLQLTKDPTAVAFLKSLSHTPSSLKRQFNQYVFHGTPPDTVDIWLQRIFASRELLHEAVSIDDADENAEGTRLKRSITFEPEYRQAGISVLAYFGEILRSRYPESNARVSIEQEGSTVTLVVVSSTGEVERIERELTQYGLVVAGQMTPAQLLPNPIEATRLQHKLDIAQLEIRHTKELLASERSQNEKSMDSMKSEIAFIRSILDKTQYEAAHNVNAILALADGNEKVLLEALSVVAKLVVASDEARSAELQSRLLAVQDSSPGVLDRLNELLVKGSIQGAAGNYLYAALQAVQKIL